MMFNRLECNAATAAQLRDVLEVYNRTVIGTMQEAGVRLAVHLNGGMLNLSRDLFAPVFGQLEKLELHGVVLAGAGLPDDVLADLNNLTVLILDGVTVARLTAGSLRGMDRLESVSLVNLPVLESIAKDAFAPLLATSTLQCLNINVTSPKFTCSCTETAWLVPALANAMTINAKSANWRDMEDSDAMMMMMMMPANRSANVSAHVTAAVTTHSPKCDVNIVCNAGSPAGLAGKDATDKGTVCEEPPTTSRPPVTNVTEAVAKKMEDGTTTDKPGNGAPPSTTTPLSATLFGSSILLLLFSIGPMTF